MQKLLWNLAYLVGKTPWDTGVTPPELRSLIETGQVKPGRALDLGCGTGTNVIYMAHHGFEVAGVDISARAIGRAQHKIKRAGLAERAQVFTGDVTRLDTLPVHGLFDLALDIGCLHSLDAAARQRYAASLSGRLCSGGLYLLYAFGPRQRFGQQLGLTPQEVELLFSPAFALQHVLHGGDHTGPASAWYTFQRR